MNNNRHLRYLNLAKIISELSDFEPYKIGCVLTHGKQIVSVGHNCQKTHPLQKRYNRYRNLKGTNIIHKAHAETICISKAKKLGIDFSNCLLYIYREHKDGSFAMARPCKSCLNILMDCGVKTIIYTTNENNYIIEKLR